MLTTQQPGPGGHGVRPERRGRVGEEQDPPARAHGQLLAPVRRARPAHRQARGVEQPHPRIVAVLADEPAVGGLGAADVEHDDVEPRHVALRDGGAHRRQRDDRIVPQGQQNRDRLGDLRDTRRQRVQMQRRRRDQDMPKWEKRNSVSGGESWHVSEYRGG